MLENYARIRGSRRCRACAWRTSRSTSPRCRQRSAGLGRRALPGVPPRHADHPGRTKALNRAAEHRLLEAEAFAAIAQLSGFSYPHDEIETAWKTVLLNQFHDILPGSSIAEVYQDTIPELEEVVRTATAVRDAALVHLGGPGTTLHPAND